eukprot:454290-Amphidinium_carterae.1
MAALLVRLVHPLRGGELEDVDDDAANRLVTVEVGLRVELLNVVGSRVVCVEAPSLTVALLVLVEVEKVNLHLVLEVLMEVDVEVVFVAALLEGLVLPLLGGELEDVDDDAANRVVDVEVDLGIELQLLDVVDCRVVCVAAPL